MKHTFVRPARPADAHEAVEWMLKTANNEFDPEVVKFPTTVTWCAYTQDGPVAYLPVQQPFMADALGSRPGADYNEVAAALKELMHNLVSQAHIKGVGEIYFLTKDEATARFAENHHFEEIPYRLFRVKMADLERRG